MKPTAAATPPTIPPTVAARAPRFGTNAAKPRPSNPPKSDHPKSMPKTAKMPANTAPAFAAIASEGSCGANASDWPSPPATMPTPIPPNKPTIVCWMVSGNLRR